MKQRKSVRRSLRHVQRFDDTVPVETSRSRVAADHFYDLDDPEQAHRVEMSGSVCCQEQERQRLPGSQHTPASEREIARVAERAVEACGRTGSEILVERDVQIDLPRIARVRPLDGDRCTRPWWN